MEKIDQRLTNLWAIASAVSAGGVIGGYSAFLLVNRETGREHQLHVPNGGLNFALSAGGSEPSYKLFQTTRPVSFDDFDGIGCRITSANIGVIWGYSLTYLTLWDGAAYVDKRLAYVKMSGGGFLLPGGSVVHGVTFIAYGSGRRSGTVRLAINLQIEDPPEKRLARVKVTAAESPKIVIPDNVLFDFDKATIKPDANETLLEVADVLNNRDRGSVIIEGHTDSIGKDAYNKTLSEKRAQAVKDWMIEHKVYGASQFVVRGLGETAPIAPNITTTGADAPSGRSRNRRVEIKFKGSVPTL